MDETQALVLEPQEDPVSRAINMWAGNTTRPETWGREDKVKEKIAVINRFFSFIGKHPADVTTSMSITGGAILRRKDNP